MAEGESYIESILIRSDNVDNGNKSMFSDNDCDEIFEFEGTVKLVQIAKSVQNKFHNRHDYIFKIQEITKLERQSE